MAAVSRIFGTVVAAGVQHVGVRRFCVTIDVRAEDERDSQQYSDRPAAFHLQCWNLGAPVPAPALVRSPDDGVSVDGRIPTHQAKRSPEPGVVTVRVLECVLRTSRRSSDPPAFKSRCPEPAGSASSL